MYSGGRNGMARLQGRPFNPCAQPDIHEILKGMAAETDRDDSNLRLGTAVSTESSAVTNVGIEDTELYFDSVNRDTSSSLNAGEIKWSINSLNYSQDVRNCVQIRLGNFYFPKLYTTAGKPEFFYYRRVFMEILDAPSNQAVLAANGNRFHFEFEVAQINGQAVELRPIKQTFFFQRPLVSLSQFSVRFLVPSHELPNTLRRVPIRDDRVAITSLLTGGIGYNPMRFRITSGQTTTDVLGQVGTITSPGLAVFITMYASGSSAVNAAVNHIDGVYVTNILNDTDFEIEVDSSAVTAEYTAVLYIPKNRFAFPVRFTSVRDQYTNYVTSTHS